MTSIEYDSFLQDILESATKRFCASVLGEIEAFTGQRDEAARRTILDTANRSKRAIFRSLTGIEVESAHGD